MTRFARIGFGLALGLICAVAFIAGCQGTTSAGTKYTMRPDRKLQAQLPAELGSVHDKAVAVLRNEYQFNVTREAKDRDTGVVEARTARNEKVTVHTYREGPNLTTVRVWHGGGPFGDTGKASQILNAIEGSVSPNAAASGESTK